MLIMQMAYRELVRRFKGGYTTKRGQKESLCPADSIPT
jgi:hypothetical protein